jgi:hypothetical protein
MVSEFHNRHIGLTYKLAYRLALVLQNQYDAPKPWRQVLARLDADPLSKDMLPTGPKQNVRLAGVISLSAAPVYAIYRLAMPLVQMACRELGVCFLAIEDDDSYSFYQVTDLIEYDEILTEKICELAAKDHPRSELELFWTDRAFTLRTYSDLQSSLQQPALEPGELPYHDQRVNPYQSLPEPDALSVAIFYRMDAMPKSLQEYENLQRLPVRFRQQRTPRRREEGLSGVTLSRSLEDVDRLLLSELMYPPAIRADRLLNTGYLVTERNPKQEKLRDVLIVGVLPPHTGELTSRAFVKTCWFNTMMILAQVLVRHRLINSEFWWIEGDTLERCSTAVFPLSRIKARLKSLNKIQVLGNKQFRNTFLELTGWQPDFLDPVAPQPIQVEDQHNDIIPPVRWICSTARKQLPNQSKALADMVNEFSIVHMLNFLPSELVIKQKDKDQEADPWGWKVEAQLRYGLGLMSSPLHNLSLTCLAPGESRAPTMPVVTYLGHYYRQKYAWKAGVPEGDLGKLASQLEKAWLDEIFRELQSEY